MSRLRRRHPDTSGFTLVEVLVAMTLLTIVIALATGLINKALDHNSSLTQQSEAQNRNDTGMEQLTRALRQAVLPLYGSTTNSSIITVALPGEIQFTTRLTSTETAQASPSAWSAPIVRVQAYLDTANHQLKWGTGNQNACAGPTVCTYAAPAANRVLVSGVRNDLGATACPANTGGTAVFKYWYVDASGNLAAWSAANPNSPTTAELARISVVQIDLWTQTKTGPQTPTCVALTDYVQLRNWK
jgi:prepilin-type N-terminal cleavage/methylation domain-containing protein